jgi:ABC-type Fe3+ transport system substrate-binding protein
MFIVNKNLVAAKDYPKSFANLLEAKWKGKLVMDNESYDLLAAMLDYYGESEGKRMAENLGNRSRVFAAAPLWLANWSLPANSR